MDTPPITVGTAQRLVAQHGSPLYVYSSDHLRERAQILTNLMLPYGLTVRYALKSNPYPDIISLFHQAGLHFDASSSYEAAQLLAMGIPGDHISLSSQQPAHNLPELLAAGVHYIATSMHQLKLFADTAERDAHVGLRVNAGVGSGHNNRTRTAGVAASFGLWHEYVGQALAFAEAYRITIDTLHTHIGSGSDPNIWGQAMDAALAIAEQMPDVTTLDIGGGYKIARVAGESETDMNQVAAVFSERLTRFAERTGRKLHLEIEPGTWLVGHAGTLLTEIIDSTDTGVGGYRFLRTNTGMNDFLRPTLYGAQHRMFVLNDASEQNDYVVVGHNCESGDILTTEPGNPEAVRPIRLNQPQIGDLLAIADTGAYCGALRAKGYNTYPSAEEVLV